MPVTVHVTEESIFVVEQESKRIRMNNSLKELRYIVINDDMHERAAEITLCFLKKQGFYSEVILKVQRIEELLASIICLRSLLNIPFDSKINSLDLCLDMQIFLHNPDFTQKVQGFAVDAD